MATSVQYGTTNPRGMDPWPIEQVIAPAAYGGSQSEAQQMLDMYQKQREAAGNVYGEDLAAQHQFAYQQLANQLYETKLKEAPNLLNAPGGAHLMGAGGIPGMDLGTDPTVMQGVISAADAAQQAKQFEAGGKGYEGYSNAGVTIPSNALPGLPPGTPATQTENVRLAQERLRDAAMLGVASIHANAKAAGDALPRVTRQVPNAYGGVDSTSFPPKMSQAQRDAYSENQGLVRTDQPPPNAPLPGTDVQGAPAAAPKPGATGLQPAASPAAAPNRGAQNEAAGKAAAQQQFLANQDRVRSLATPQQWQNIQAGMKRNGGLPDLVPGGPSGWRIRGGDGTLY